MINRVYKNVPITNDFASCTDICLLLQQTIYQKNQNHLPLCGKSNWWMLSLFKRPLLGLNSSHTIVMFSSFTWQKRYNPLFYFLISWGQHHILEIDINLIRLRVERFRWHDDVIKWKHFPRYWPFVRGIHRSLVNSPQKGQCRGALIFSLICAWINGWVNNREAGDLRRHRAHYDVIVTDKTQSEHSPMQYSCDFDSWR